ncbi:MAG: hypothetical protein NTU53_19550 [Planctomycetota bacterium]|nr:hypothetical protein [Planctomycetota bacterium]
MAQRYAGESWFSLGKWGIYFGKKPGAQRWEYRYDAVVGWGGAELGVGRKGRQLNAT